MSVDKDRYIRPADEGGHLPAILQTYRERDSANEVRRAVEPMLQPGERFTPKPCGLVLLRSQELLTSQRPELKVRRNVLAQEITKLLSPFNTNVSEHVISGRMDAMNVFRRPKSRHIPGVYGLYIKRFTMDEMSEEETLQALKGPQQEICDLLGVTEEPTHPVFAVGRVQYLSREPRAFYEDMLHNSLDISLVVHQVHPVQPMSRFNH